jgi:hypothetical protein
MTVLSRAGRLPYLLSQIRPIHIPKPYFAKIHLSSVSSTSRSSDWSLRHRISSQNVLIICDLCDTFYMPRPSLPPFDHPKEYKLWSSSLCSIIHPVASSLLGPNKSVALQALTNRGRLSSRRWQSFPTAPDGTGLTCGQHIESHSCIFLLQRISTVKLRLKFLSNLYYNKCIV